MEKNLNYTEVFELKILDEEMKTLCGILAPLDCIKTVVTVNIQHLVEINKNPKLFQEYKSADIITCDSRIVQLLSKYLKAPIINVIPGSDLTKYLVESYLSDEESLAIIGSEEPNIKVFQKKYKFKNFHHYNPPMGFINSDIEIEKILDFLNEKRPKYIFLALGAMRQEILAFKIKKSCDFAATVFCIGASIDFLTGAQIRAPKIFQKARLEWFYRFLKTPQRLFKRYFIDGLSIIPIFFRQYRN